MVVDKHAKLTSRHFKDAKKVAYKFLDILPSNLSYHCKDHTDKFVLPNALRLSKKEKFPLEDRILLSIAAVFHDVGFIHSYNANEPIAAKFAQEYLSSNTSKYAYSPHHIQIIVDAIEETDLFKIPTSHISEVLRDADLSYMGMKNKCVAWNDKLRAESLAVEESSLHEVANKELEWYATSINFWKRHEWFTKSAKKLFDKNKQNNLNNLINLASTYAIFPDTII